jgi:serine/threonine protein kinase/tetratricopeptide (TPR) repeat protein
VTVAPGVKVRLRPGIDGHTVELAAVAFAYYLRHNPAALKPAIAPAINNRRMIPGESVGPYIILNSLGSGGMGEVYRARDERLNREVALKRLSDVTLESDVVRRRFLKVARAAAALSHPNIATIFDVLDTGGGPAIVMEYVPGDSLARVIERSPVPTEQALEFALQMSEGLAEAHTHGIVHRDLKPANIVITPAGRLKILDFGIARSMEADPKSPGAAGTVDPRTEAGRIPGTPGYMSPEQITGGRVDQRTDIYAVGVLLYEMLTGRRPFQAPTPFESAMAAVSGAAPPLSELAPAVPSHVSALVERAMAKEPAQRFQTATELADELRHARRRLVDAVTEASSDVAVQPLSTGRSLARGKPLALVLAALVAIAAAAIGWRWIHSSTLPIVSAHGSSLAMLPFRNTTADPANDSVALGVTEGVANRLSSLDSLRVLPLEESRDAASGGADPVHVARALGAGFVVSGELGRVGQTLDIEVSLVKSDGQRRAVGRYTGDAARVFDLHRRVADGVTSALAREGVVPSAVSTQVAPPTSDQQAFAEYSQARLFLERPDVPGNLDHAVRLFQSAIAKDNRFALAHAGLGQAYWAQYRETQDTAWTSRATAAILDALRIDPDQPEVRLSLAVMYQGLGRLDAAAEELNRVLAVQPRNDDAHRLLAGIHIDRSEWDAAVAELQRAIDLRPNYWRNHSELGYTHYRAGRVEEALKAYQRVVELQPDSARGYHMLGTVYQSAGRLAEALQNYGRANAMRPSPATSSNIGTIHFWNGDYQKAADAYQQAIKLAPSQPDLYANLGDALQKLGQRDRARASYKTAVTEVRKQLAVNENDAFSMSLLALYLAKLDDRAAAADAARKAISLNSQDGEVLYSTAVVAALGGRSTEACARLEEALAHGASHEVVRRADELRSLKGCAAYDRILTR